MGLFDTWDDIFNKSISKLDDYSDVNRIDEIINIMKGFRNDIFFKELSKIQCRSSDNLAASDNDWIIDLNKISKFKVAKEGLGQVLPFYLPPLTKIINFNQLLGIHAIIGYSYVYSTGHCLTVAENKGIILGNIGERVTFFVEDFDKDEVPHEFNISFFKKLKNIKFENKRTSKLKDYIYDIDTSIAAEFSLPSVFGRTLIHGTIYLMGCNALKYNRDVITCDDVVSGFLTTFKILMSDLRPLIPLTDYEE